MGRYLVGLRQEKRSKSLLVEDEDALLAALRAKRENPDAMITYVRKSNRRGDRRHPHETLGSSKSRVRQSR
jgi:hypothetical protein